MTRFFVTAINELQRHQSSLNAKRFIQKLFFLLFFIYPQIRNYAPNMIQKRKYLDAACRFESEPLHVKPRHA